MQTAQLRKAIEGLESRLKQKRVHRGLSHFYEMTDAERERELAPFYGGNTDAKE